MVKHLKPWLLPAATAVLAAFLKNDFIRFLLGFELLLYAVSLWTLHRLKKRVTCTLELPESVVRRGNPCAVECYVTNRSSLPIPDVVVRAAVRAFPDEEELLLRGKISLAPKETGKLVFTLGSDHYSCLELRPERIMVHDLLGLFDGKCPVPPQEPKLLFILPDGKKGGGLAESDRIYSTAEDGGQYRQGHTTADNSDIRLYQPGDSRRQIHWKLSARMDELMVRELRDPAEELMHVYLNLLSPPRGKKKTRDRAQWDHFMDVTAAVTGGLLEAGVPHRVMWLDTAHGTVADHRISDEETQQTMLCALLRVEGFLPDEPGNLLKELRLDETEGDYIEIDLQGNLARRGQGG